MAHKNISGNETLPCGKKSPEGVNCKKTNINVDYIAFGAGEKNSEVPNAA